MDGSGGSQRGNGWRGLNTAPALASKYPKKLLRDRTLLPRRWRQLDGAQAECFELSARDNGDSAYLIVAPMQANRGFAVSPSLVLTTAGRCVAVWAS